MRAEIQVGPQVLGPGSVATMSGNPDGAGVIVQAHGRYTEAVRRGKVFMAANSATQALSTNSTTATGIILSNPAGSGVNLSLLEISVALASLPAGQSGLILVGSIDNLGATVTHTTPLTVRNALVGGPAGAAKVDSAATVPTGAILRHIGGGPAATVAAGTAFPPFIRDEISGLLMLPPNTYISLQALTTAITVLASIAWEEIPI